MRQVEPQQELVHPDTTVNQVDGEIPPAKDSVAVLQLIRRNHLGLVTFSTEELCEKLELAGFRRLKWLPELHNSDVGLCFGLLAELLVRFQQGRQQVLRAANLRNCVLLRNSFIGWES